MVLIRLVGGWHCSINFNTVHIVVTATNNYEVAHGNWAGEHMTRKVQGGEGVPCVRIEEVEGARGGAHTQTGREGGRRDAGWTVAEAKSSCLPTEPE